MFRTQGKMASVANEELLFDTSFKEIRQWHVHGHGPNERQNAACEHQFYSVPSVVTVSAVSVLFLSLFPFAFALAFVLAFAFEFASPDDAGLNA